MSGPGYQIVRRKGCTVEIQFNRFAEVAKKLPDEADLIVRKTAFDVKAASQASVHVKTGACKNSHYVVTYDASGASDAAAAALAVNPKVMIVPAQVTVHKGEAAVVVGVNYAIWLELRYPYLSPATERILPEYVSAMEAMVNRL